MQIYQIKGEMFNKKRKHVIKIILVLWRRGFGTRGGISDCIRDI